MGTDIRAEARYSAVNVEGFFAKNGRLGSGKSDAPNAVNVRGIGHSITAKQLEQHP